MHTITDVVEMARCSAVTALDQAHVFGTIPNSRDVHYENIIDTLYEHRKSLVRGLNWNFGKVLRLAHDEYDKEIDRLLNE